MTIVEKNDVDISKLFIWGKKFEVEDAEENTLATVYMRLPGDADLNRTRVYALRKSQELRKKLRDVNSEERLLYVKDKEELGKDELVSMVIALSMREINNRALREVKITRPKQPKSDADLERMEKYQAEVDAYPQKRRDAVEKFIKGEVEKLKAALDSRNEDELYKMYVRLIIDEFCEQEAYRSYKDMETFLGCYSDENYTVRLWDSFEQFDNLPPEIKEQFRAAYDSLSIDMDDLKKLRAATQ